jgi:hypothetical protein
MKAFAKDFDTIIIAGFLLGLDRQAILAAQQGQAKQALAGSCTSVRLDR